MEATFKLARIRGIDVGIHFSWFIVVVLFTVIFAQSQYPATYPDWTEAQYWTVALASVLLLFLSVLLHEFGHAIVAQSRGVEVRSITLFIFGGVAGLARESDEAGDEFWIAIAGPIVSISLAGIFGFAWLIFSGINEQAAALLGYLAYVNLILVLFNMIPGFPLDGGRVLRSAIWRATDDMRKATRIVSGIGVAIGTLFVAGGLLLIVAGYLVNGIWAVVIGWFLQSAAQQGRNAVEQTHAFRDILTRDLMHTAPVTIGPNVDLETMAEDFVLARNARGIPVVDGQTLLGIATVTDLRKIPRDQWSGKTVREVMTPASAVKYLQPEVPVVEALGMMSEGDFHQMPVTEDGRLVGLLTRFELVRYFQTREELGLGN
ncbi:MAG: site-2 protease family protein [Thermomicrobiales bacterium]